MEVISVGFLRTGTTSMKLALEQLGFGPCYHLKELVNEPSRSAEWLAVAKDPDSADWKQIYAKYNSAVGTPTTSPIPTITTASISGSTIDTSRRRPVPARATSRAAQHPPATAR